MKKRLFTGLVTARPPVETPAKGSTGLQEISSAKPKIMVPQRSNNVDARERVLLTIDAAITPADLTGAYGIPAWALDTARMIRARNVAKKMGALVPTRNHNGREYPKPLLEHLATLPMVQGGAAAARLALTMGEGLIASIPEQSMGWAHHLFGRDRISTWDDTVNLARKMWETSLDNHEVERRGPSSPDDGEEGELPSWLPEGEPEEGDDNSFEEKDNGDQFLPQSWNMDTSKIPRRHGDSGPGTIDNDDCFDTLPMQRRPMRRGERRRPEIEGPFPRSWHRMPLDGKVFRGAPMRGGYRGRGTILVDLSGSMQWEAEDFDKMVKHLPECTVLGYSGYRNGGRMVVLADRGAAASGADVLRWRRKHHLGGNIIDVPALHYLARMPEPRIYIGDGGYTGVGDSFSEYVCNLSEDAIKQGKIKRFESATSAAKHFQTAKR